MDQYKKAEIPINLKNNVKTINMNTGSMRIFLIYLSIQVKQKQSLLNCKSVIREVTLLAYNKIQGLRLLLLG